MNKDRRFMSLMAKMSTYASAYMPEREPGYVADYEPVDVKGDPGQYNKLKHMSKAQRKRYKERLRRKK